LSKSHLLYIFSKLSLLFIKKAFEQYGMSEKYSTTSLMSIGLSKSKSTSLRPNFKALDDMYSEELNDD